MSEITKQALKVANNTEFPNNNTGYITPSRLRGFNTDMIDSLVDEIKYNEDSASWNADILLISASATVNITPLNEFTASQNTKNSTLASVTQSLFDADSTFTTKFTNIGTQSGSWDNTQLNVYTASQDTKNLTLATYTGSVDTKFNTIGTYTASVDNKFTNIGNQSSSWDNTQLNSYTASQDIKNSTLASYTGSNDTKWNTLGNLSGSFATTGSNQFRGDQTITGSLISSGSNGVTFIGNNGTQFQLGSSGFSSGARFGNLVDFEVYFAGDSKFYGDNLQLEGPDPIFQLRDNSIPLNISYGMRSKNTELQFIDGVSDISMLAMTTASFVVSSSANISGSLTASLQEGHILVGNSVNKTYAFSTASFATTGSNLFRGVQTLENGGTNRAYISTTSGSLIFSSVTEATSSTNISSSINGTNILLNSNTTQQPIVLSSFYNVIGLPGAALTTGFSRRYAGFGNLALFGAGLPQITGSMTVPITYNTNIHNTSATSLYRGPVTSSGVTAWDISNNIINGNGSLLIGTSDANNAEKIVNGLSIGGNIINGAQSIIANKTPLETTLTIGNNTLGVNTYNLNSSSMTINTSELGGVTITNNGFTTLGTASQRLSRIANTKISGLTNTIIFGGETTPMAAGAVNRAMASTTVFGNNNILSVEATGPSGSTAMNGVTALGSWLIVSGSNSLASAAAGNQGSVFFGRWNSIDGKLASSGETILAVGTGNSTQRRTGFHIDSGSNSTFSGSLSVNGPTSMTGSLTIQSGSGDLFMYGHKMFSIGGFTSTISQSGSAGVSQSVSYNTTDVSQGITLNGGGTQLTLANAGYYNIQFSLQILSTTGADSVYIWLKKNGTNVPNSAGKVTLANNEELLTSWNYVVEGIAGDYFEVVWQNSASNGVLLYAGAAGNYPALPSAIVTVTQVR